MSVPIFWTRGGRPNAEAEPTKHLLSSRSEDEKQGTLSRVDLSREQQQGDNAARGDCGVIHLHGSKNECYRSPGWPPPLGSKLNFDGESPLDPTSFRTQRCDGPHPSASVSGCSRDQQIEGVADLSPLKRLSKDQECTRIDSFCKQGMLGVSILPTYKNMRGGESDTPAMETVHAGDVPKSLPLKKRKYVTVPADDIRQLPVEDLTVARREGVAPDCWWVRHKSRPPRRPRLFPKDTATLSKITGPESPPERFRGFLGVTHQVGCGPNLWTPEGLVRRDGQTSPQTQSPTQTTVPKQGAAHSSNKGTPVATVSRNDEMFLSQIVNSMTQRLPISAMAAADQSSSIRGGDLRRIFLARTAPSRSGLPNWKPLDLSRRSAHKTAKKDEDIQITHLNTQTKCDSGSPPEKRQRSDEGKTPMGVSTEKDADNSGASGTAARASGGGPCPSESMPINPQHSLRMLRECELAVKPDEDGDLPLHIAVVKGDIPTVEKLVPMMKMEGVCLDYRNSLWQTPLHLAVITNQPLMVKKLLEEGASPNGPDRHGNASIHLAVLHGSPECLSCILAVSKERPNLDAKNYEGLTPLHVAVQNGDVDLVNTLLKEGATLDVTDGKSGRTPLHHATEAHNEQIVEVLLSQGSKVNAQSYSGNTPLHNASGRKFTDIVSILVRYGADPTIKNANNETYTNVAKETKIQVNTSHTGPQPQQTSGQGQGARYKKTHRSRRPTKPKSTGVLKQEPICPVMALDYHSYALKVVPPTDFILGQHGQGRRAAQSNANMTDMRDSTETGSKRPKYRSDLLSNARISEGSNFRSDDPDPSGDENMGVTSECTARSNLVDPSPTSPSVAPMASLTSMVDGYKDKDKDASHSTMLPRPPQTEQTSPTNTKRPANGDHHGNNTADHVHEIHHQSLSNEGTPPNTDAASGGENGSASSRTFSPLATKALLGSDTSNMNGQECTHEAERQSNGR